MYSSQNFNGHIISSFLVLFFLTALIVLPGELNGQSDNKDVTITACGSGVTAEDARQAALRTATEQAFGAFISSKTEMFNDHIVADQMSSVSSGNIKSYEILNEAQFPDERWGVTLKAVVSVDRLTSFVQAKGVEIEIKGGLFAANIKQQMLNEQGELETIYEMVGLLHETMQTAFDYTITSGDPRSSDGQNTNWEIPLHVTATCNENIDFCANYFINTVNSVALTASEVESYKSLDKPVFPVGISYNNVLELYFLRTQLSLDVISAFTANWKGYTSSFIVNSGFDEPKGSTNVNSQLFEFSKASPETWGDTSVIYFPTAGYSVAKFNWNDQRSLHEIERISGYSVQPSGILSRFAHGGIVLYEENGHGLVVLLFDIEMLKWKESGDVCYNLEVNGYQDWRLPSCQEMELIYEKRNLLGKFEGQTQRFGDEWPTCYWCSDIVYKYAPGGGVMESIHHDCYNFDISTKRKARRTNCCYTSPARPVRAF